MTVYNLITMRSTAFGGCISIDFPPSPMMSCIWIMHVPGWLLKSIESVNNAKRNGVLDKKEEMTYLGAHTKKCRPSLCHQQTEGINNMNFCVSVMSLQRVVVVVVSNRMIYNYEGLFNFKWRKNKNSIIHTHQTGFLLYMVIETLQPRWLLEVFQFLKACVTHICAIWFKFPNVCQLENEG